MTCCVGPLIAGGVIASGLSLFSGLVNMDFLLIAGGLGGIILIGGGYLYREKLTKELTKLYHKFI